MPRRAKKAEDKKTARFDVAVTPKMREDILNLAALSRRDERGYLRLLFADAILKKTIL